VPILIDTVRIANFRSLRNVEVSLAPVTVLVGMNNSGKTSFLKALNLALGGDRRLVGQDDFFVEDDPAAKPPDRIVIDVRIVPVDGQSKRVGEFDESWLNTEFGGEIIGFDEGGRQYVAVRTTVQFENVRNEYVIERRPLADWGAFGKWQDTQVKPRVSTRFEQIPVFLMDAQRDIVSDLRNRTSYVGRLLAKVEMPPEAVREIEEQLKALNAGIVGSSEVLAHLQHALEELNQTVPSTGKGVEITPVSKKVRDITKGLDIQFQDSAASGFSLDYHGMGTRSWASLLTYQAYVSWLDKQAGKDGGKPYHPVLALEEPEAHLHPNAQRQVYHQLRGGIGQKIISTHSPYLAAQADLAELRHFHKDKAETAVAGLVTVDLTAEDQRKIRREVLHTRGELLFARAVVLFEGETEEQALPIFARAYWGREPFELGVCMIGVGGDGNYLPFLRVAKALQIPWYIFSDGESAANNAVETALTGIRLVLPHKSAIIVPGNNNIERQLVAEGYQGELKEAVIAFQKPSFKNEHHRAAKVREIKAWGDADLAQYLKSWKTKISPHWAEVISGLSGKRQFPTPIRQLLKQVSTDLRIPVETRDAR